MLESTIDNGVTKNFTFNGLGQMMTADTASYTYDGLGRLASRNGAALNYSGLSNQATTDGASTVSRDANGGVVAMSQGGISAGIVSDRHGDVVATVDSTGAVTDSLSYDPWGKRLSQFGATDVRWGFQGSYTDADTELVNMGARWFDTAGAFTARDTWSGAATHPVTLNRYAYGNNNPMSFNDPDGRCARVLDGTHCIPTHKPSKPPPSPTRASVENNNVKPPRPSPTPPRAPALLR